MNHFYFQPFSATPPELYFTRQKVSRTKPYAVLCTFVATTSVRRFWPQLSGWAKEDCAVAL